MTQTQRILKHMQHGKSITPLEALGVYGVYRLGARIHDLRLMGHDITTTIEVDENGKQYAKYSLTFASEHEYA